MSLKTTAPEAEGTTGREPSGRRERASGGLLATVYRIPHLGLTLVLLLVVLFTATQTDAFLTEGNLINVLRQVSITAVIAAALTLVMVAGGMDFSMGSSAYIIAAFAAQLIDSGTSVTVTILASIGLAMGIGLVNGLVVTYTKVAPFVVTLATATILDGFQLVVLDGKTVSSGDALAGLGAGYFLGLPNLTCTALVVLAVTALIMKYTTYGRDLFAIGGNEHVARLSGIGVNRNKLLLYAGAGALSGLAGVMLLSRLVSSSPSPGGGLMLQLGAVAAVVIGGTSLEGGRGTVVGTILGVILLGVVANALNLLQISSFYQPVSVGTVLVIAAVANQLQKSRHQTH
ncbi:ABC transporter permease [Streptomyces sp. TRM68416]|uniref:ABC transporter permease n=1 Tax=Streptomyces sp. TRM68416 TaxID=2758412 RepID=UPI001661C917|nr:ABC transporter permease [Streptomyces sp. TRM68416]MBD0844016.1 ABC transporter permease [Streptomyces sp. TRM68416]